MYLQSSGKANSMSLKKQFCQWVFTLALALLFVGCASQGRNQDTYGMTQGQGIVATGYAVISSQHGDTPAQKRLRAIKASKLDAYRALTEQVYGQQLDASSTVADMVVTNDTFRTKVEGVIYGARLVSITPVGEDTYETTLSLDRDVVQDLRILYMGQLAARGR